MATTHPATLSSPRRGTRRALKLDSSYTHSAPIAERTDEAGRTIRVFAPGYPRGYYSLDFSHIFPVAIG